jgi:uncharacterized protein YigE (DUF2233 family)
MKNFKHYNNSKLRGGYSAMLAFNPKPGVKVPLVKIIDMYLDNWQLWRFSYNTYLQSIRMIDDKHQPVYWQKNPNMKSSMTVFAVDKDGNVLFVFTRSPYSANEMTDMLLSLPLNVHNAMYLDGGPEASFYLNHNGYKVEKVGCYVSTTFEKDDNDHFWEIPNIIGIRKR